MSNEPHEDDRGESDDTSDTRAGDGLTEDILTTRRKVLAAAGAAGASAFMPGVLSAGGAAQSTTDSLRQDTYVAAASSAISESELEDNEFVWKSDGEMGVYDGTQLVHNGIGSSSAPVPSVTTEKQVFSGPDATAGVGVWQDLIMTSDGKYWDVSSSVSDADAATKLQNALEDVSASGWVYAPPRTYNGTLTLFPTDKNEVTLFSYGRQGAHVVSDGTDHAVTINVDQAYRGSIENMAFETASGGGNAVDAIHMQDSGSGSAATNFKLLNVRATGSDRDGIHVESGVTECPIVSCEVSAAGDIDRNQLYVDSEDVSVFGGAYEINGGAASGVNNIKTGPNSAYFTFMGFCGQNPNIHIDGGPYNDLVMLGTKGVDLTFASTSSNSIVECTRFSSVTDNGSTNGYWERFNVKNHDDYSLTNVTTDRSFDADNTTTAELADVLGTLIQDLNADAT